MAFVLFLIALLFGTACSSITGAARRIVSTEAADANSSLVVAATGSPICPEGCKDGFCVSDSTGGTTGYRCLQCVNNLFVRKLDGTCVCIAGRYSPYGAPSCSDCPVGFYCTGGVWTAADWPRAVKCPANMTTRGARGVNDRACVNVPGYRYSVLNGIVSAVICPPDSYSPGMRKQRACVPCPNGFSTMGKWAQTVPQSCVLPPGHFLKGPGQVAPCPMGEYKSGVGSDGNCLKCAVGVTTLTFASTSVDNCSVLQPGWFATNMTGDVITAASPCPQGFYCPGGPAIAPFDRTNPISLDPAEPSIKACPDGMWTVDVASTSIDQCLTPPGFKTVNGTTVPCEAGSYRADWATPGQATSCTACGVGVLADKTDRVVQYDVISYMPVQIPVTTSTDDCYILPGQGLYYEVLSQGYRVRNCVSNAYGVDKVTYGLSASPCRPCPQNMVTSTNRTAYPNSASYFVNSTEGYGGFTSAMACVNQAGYGYNGRVSQLCDQGMFNPADTYSTCTSCGFGLTTQAVGSGKSRADCGIAIGFGWNGAAVVPCPLGTYNNKSFTASQTTPCSNCPTGTTTQNTGSDDVNSCSLCMGGWGGPGCQSQCGGRGAAATYGENGRPFNSDCLLCSWSSAGFSFQWQLQNDLFSAQALSPIGADSSWDCVSEFAQISDGAWYLPTAGNTAMNVTAGIRSFAECVALCTPPDCEYVTYDYRAQTCYVRIAYPPEYMGAPLIAFKAVPSGDVATNAFSLSIHRHGAPNNASLLNRTSASVFSSSSNSSSSSQGPVRATAVASGQYSFYIEPYASTVGTQTPAPQRDTYKLGFDGLQQCLNACDDATWCVGVTMQLFVDVPTSPRSCSLIRGDSSPGKYLRTVTRADVNRLRVPPIFN